MTEKTVTFKANIRNREEAIQLLLEHGDHLCNILKLYQSGAYHPRTDVVNTAIDEWNSIALLFEDERE